MLDFGSGVSRTLDAAARQFSAVVWQKGKPPLDSELNLMSQQAWESLRQIVHTSMPSGFFMDPTRALQDFQFDPYWSNFFKLGSPRVPFGTGEQAEKTPMLWANINGWVLPVVGTDTVEGDLANVIKLASPPETDTRIDYAFLEAWLTRVDPNPSVVNKPSSSTLWKYGNVKYGGTNLTDDLEDPTLSFETTGRIQLQYRIRVHGQGVGLGASVALDVYPEGLGDPNILGQGTAASPVAPYAFTNMREELGDVGLWRAGNGNPNNALGTIDGYTYAVPVCAVFRRASNIYVAVNPAGNPNHNGAFSRTKGTAARVLTQATLTADLSPTTALAVPATINITNLNGSGLEDNHTWSSVFLMLDDEIIGISARDVNAGTITIPAGGRGRYGTAAVGHPAGTAIRFFNTRPDGLYSDQIAESDILDLRHAVNPNDWDFGRLLEHNVSALLKGELRSTWKKAAAGNTQGVSSHEVTFLWADGAHSVPNQTEEADGPDGIRTIWSDAAVIQPDVTVLLDNTAPQDNNQVGLTNENTFTSGAGYSWDVGAGFYPSGYMNVGTDADKQRFTNGTSIFLFLGGRNGTGGARATFRDGATRAVRAVTPKEFWKMGYPTVDTGSGNQNPVTLRFLTERAHEPSPPEIGTAKAVRHVGPMYPWRDTNFERPFIVLGGLLRSEMKKVVSASDLTNTGTSYEIDVGINFDAPGVYFSYETDGVTLSDDPKTITNPLLRDHRTLHGMLSDGGRDKTGGSSEVYVVLYGDPASRNNNGVFKVIGAGTVGYTNVSATNATSLVVLPICPEFSGFDDGTGNTLTLEFRSQETNADDTSAYDSKVADFVVVLTDIGGLTEHPWKRSSLGYGAPDGYDISMPFYPNPAGHVSVPSKLLVSLTLLYHPGRGGTVRVPDSIVRFAMKGGIEEDEGAYLRQSPVLIDPTFAATGVPSNEVFWDPTHVQLWNRLPALGWYAPEAPDYGGNVVGFTEQDREHELFFDRGSKTILFRPFRDRRMTIQEQSWSEVAGLPLLSCLLGEYHYAVGGHHKDSLRMFTGEDIDQGGTGKKMGFPVPREFMPRFGRQDIPYYRDVSAGGGPFLSGINHLFRDEANINSPVFHIIGGDPTAPGAPAVYSMLFVTGLPPVYAKVPVYGAADTMPAAMNNKAFIWARRAPTDILTPTADAAEIIRRLGAVNSSDYGRGLKGIQLPPYYGVARLYGVYDVRDYDTKSGRGFKLNRYAMDDDPAPNLLREDADQQTLFIFQDGARDVTEHGGDHTYIIPYNAIDITRALNYVSGDQPEEYHYVVECVVFGFARGFINENNLVLVRRFGGTGLSIDGGTDGNVDGDDFEIKGVHMVLPCPAGYNDQFYAAYNRTVYQGDPYMSRNATKTDSDYQTRYGQLSVAAQYAMRMPIQQFDATGHFVPEIPNSRSFEVLASMDFYSTMGTGKIGGQLSPGTPLDVGFTEATCDSAVRKMDVGSYPWRVLPRAFSEGQKSNVSRAALDLVILNTSPQLNPGPAENAFIRFGLLDGSSTDIYFTRTQYLADLLVAVPTIDPSTDVAIVPEEKDARVIAVSYTGLNNDLLPGQYQDFEISVPGAETADSVLVDWPDVSSPNHSLSLRGQVTAPDTVTLRIQNMWPWSVFRMPQTSPGAPPPGAPAPFVTLEDVVHQVTWVGPVAVAEHNQVTTDFDSTAVPGLDLTRSQVAVVQDWDSPGDGILFEGFVQGDGFGNPVVRVVAKNTTAVPIVINNRSLRILILDQETAAEHTVNPFGLQIHLKVIKTGFYFTGGAAFYLSAVVNSHPDLQSSIKAYFTGDSKVRLEAVPTGSQGNGISVQLMRLGNTVPQDFGRLVVPFSNDRSVTATFTSSNLLGGLDLPMNAGDGTSQINLTGMTERLPLGALLQDSDFLCENPLRDNASAVRTSPTGPRPIQSVMPLTARGGEYTRFMGEPGELLAMSDGSISVTSFAAWRQVPEGGGGPTGSRKFRLYRGGGPAYTLSGNNPGAPLDWVSETFSPSLQPVLKGGILACRAMLVRNFREEVTPSSTYKVSDGDEIQMILITHGILSNGLVREQGITLGGLISPSGYGEGWSAADRFRLNGKPLFRGYSRKVPDPSTVDLVVYPDQQRE